MRATIARIMGENPGEQYNYHKYTTVGAPADTLDPKTQNSTREEDASKRIYGSPLPGNQVEGPRQTEKPVIQSGNEKVRSCVYWLLKGM